MIRNETCPDLIHKIKKVESKYLELPESSEKILNHMLLALLQIPKNSSYESKANIEYPKSENLDSWFNSKISQTIYYLESERQANQIIKGDLSNLEELIKDQEFTKASKKVEDILRCLVKVDLREIYLLQSQGKLDAKNLTGKDIILLLGNTGAGKSTFIHYLGGSTFNKISSSNYVPQEIPEKLKAFLLKSDIESVTREIRAVPITFSKNNKFGNNTKKDIWICDTPGFGDTDGIERDVANNLNIIRAIHEANSIRPVVLLNFRDLGARFNSIQNTLFSIMQMMVNFEDDNDKFNIMYTGVPDDEKKTIIEKLKELEEHALKNNNKAEAVAFNTVYEITCYKFINIIPDDKSKVQDIFESIISKPPIDNTTQKFKYFINKTSVELLNVQILHEKRLIIDCIKAGNFSYAGYKLGYFKKLVEELDIYRDQYGSLLETIRGLFENECDTACKFIFNQVKNFNKLLEKDLEELKTKQMMYEKGAEFRKNYLGEQDFSSQLFITTLINMLESSAIDCDFPLITNSQITNATRLMENLKLIWKYFPETEKFYKEAESNIIISIQEKQKKLINEMKNSKYEAANEILYQVSMVSTELGHLIEMSEIKFGEIIEDLNKVVKSHFSEMVNQVSTTKSETWSEVSKIQSRLKEAQRHKFIYKNSIDAEESLNSIFKNIVERCEVKVFNLKSCSESFQDVNEDIQELFRNLSILKDIPEFEMKLTPCYMELLSYIQEIMKKSINVLTEYLGNNKVPTHQNYTKNYMEIHCSFQEIKKFSWINNYKCVLYNNIVDRFKKHIRDHVLDLNERSGRINLSWKNLAHPQNYIEAAKIFQENKQIYCLTEDIPEIKKLLDDIDKTLTDKVNTIKKQLENNLSSEISQEFETNFVQNILNYISKIEQHEAFTDAFGLINFSKDLLDAYIKTNKIRLETSFEKSLKTITSQATNFSVENDLFDEVKHISNYHAVLKAIDRENLEMKEYFKSWTIEKFNKEMIEMYSSFKALKGKNNTILQKICQKLKNLDQIMPENYTFRVLDDNVGETIEKNTKIIKDLISKGDYQTVAIEFQKLSDIKSIREELQIELEKEMLACIKQAIKACTLLCSDPNTENSLFYCSQMEKLTLADEKLHGLLPNKDKLKEGIATCKKQLETHITNELEFLEQFNLETLKDYESKKKSLEKISSAVGGDLSDSLKNRILGLNKKLSEGINDFAEKIKTMDVERIFRLNVRAIYDLIKQIAPNHTSTIESSVRSWLKSQEEKIKGLPNIDEKISSSETIIQTSDFLPLDHMSKRTIDSLIKSKSTWVDVQEIFNKDIQIIESTPGTQWISGAEKLLANKEIGSLSSTVQDLCLIKLKDYSKKLQIKIKGDYLTLNDLEDILQSTTLFKISKDFEEILEKIKLYIVDHANSNTEAIKKELKSPSFQLVTIEAKMDYIFMVKVLCERSFIVDNTVLNNIKQTTQEVLNYISNSEKVFLENMSTLDSNKLITHLNMIKNSGIINKICQINVPSNYDKIKEELTRYFETLEIFSLKSPKDLKSIFKGSQRAFVSEKISNQYKNLQNFSSHYLGSDFNISDQLKLFKINLKKIYDEAQMKVSDMVFTLSNKTNYELATLNTLKESFEILVYCHDHFQQIIPIEKDLMPKIQTKFEDYIKEFEKFQTEKEIKPHAEVLIKLQKFAVTMFRFEKLFKDGINDYVDKLVEIYSTAIIGKLGCELNNDKSGFGNMIITESPKFQGYSRHIFMTKTKTQDLEWILKNLKGTDVNTNKLKDKYAIFREHYQKIIESNISTSNVVESFNNILTNVQMIASEKNWENFKVEIPKLMAYLFGYLSLSKSKDYLYSNENSYLFQPHPAQIIALFRLFGLTEYGNHISNHLVQVLTGEGKSIVLAVASCIFALHNFEVSCVCYSEYLSRRDFEEFSSFFIFFNVDKLVSYGTIKEQCERYINRNGDVRRAIEEWILKGTLPRLEKKNPLAKKSIILIDEVDVFFNNSKFTGSNYRICSQISNDKISAVTDLIWAKRDQKNLFKLITESKEYKDGEKFFENWIDLYRGSIKLMTYYVKNFNDPPYGVKDDKIAYIDNERYSTKISYGYKTLFAYYDAFNKTKITELSFKNNRCMNVLCGDFSYTEIVKMFDHIFGVTGTLKDLNNEEKNIIKHEYKIKQETFLPSVYGDSKLVYNPRTDVHCYSENDYHQEIVKEIFNKNSGRAVIVVFESIEELENFKKSPKASSLSDYAELTEATAEKERASLVATATLTGNLTLITKAYGRGTDFICRDTTVNKNGGVHVIQTFLSESLADETQIKGRTARQGEPGSYCMILQKRSLEKFSITNSEIDKWNSKDLYANLNEKRNKIYGERYKSNSQFTKDLEPLHKASVEFLENLLSQNEPKAKIFLTETNKYTVQEEISARIMVCVDGTGSMNLLLQKLKNVVHRMFKNSCEILNDNKIKGSFELQFVVYRNYDAELDKLLEKSGWEKDPNNLRTFLDKINPMYGLGNEAIEVALWHALEESKSSEGGVTQIVLIGDMPPNTEQEIVANRKTHKAIWERCFVKDVPHTDRVVEQIALKKIPIDCYYVKDTAKTEFERIATLTGGKSCFLDVNNEKNGANLLLNKTTKAILENIGNLQNPATGSVLVRAYEERFEKLNI